VKIWFLAAATTAVLTACGGDGGAGRASDTAAGAKGSGAVDLTGAGATFPYPIYSK